MTRAPYEGAVGLAAPQALRALFGRKPLRSESDLEEGRLNRRALAFDG